jgi:hypothetical protein
MDFFDHPATCNPDARVAVALHGLVSNQLDRGRTLEQIRDQFFDADTDLELIEAFSEPEWLQSVLIEARAAQ